MSASKKEMRESMSRADGLPSLASLSVLTLASRTLIRVVLPGSALINALPFLSRFATRGFSQRCELTLGRLKTRSGNDGFR